MAINGTTRNPVSRRFPWRRIALVALLVTAGSVAAIEVVAGRGYSVLRVQILEATTSPVTTWEAASAHPGWRDTVPFVIDSTARNLWLHYDIEIEDAALGGLYFSAQASADIYWDGERIARSGVVGTRASEEIPGPMDSRVLVPDHLHTPGSHELAVHLSRHTLAAPRSGASLDLVPMTVTRLHGDRLRAVLLPSINLGALVMVACYYLVLFWLDRRQWIHLCFAVLCLAMAALLVTESWRVLWGYPYDWHIFRLRAVCLFAAAVGLLLVAVVAGESRLPGQRQLILGLGVAFGLIWGLAPSFDAAAFLMLTSGLSIAALLSLWAVRQGQFSMLGVLVAAVINLGLAAVDPHRFSEQWFFLAFDLIILALLIRLGLSQRRLRSERQQARIRSERLKSELLRKHIQPHFLMNTLTSLQACLEEDSELAVEMVESLAEELRTLAEIYDRVLVPLAVETGLMRAHLRLMSIRREIRLDLVCEGLDEAMEVPPGIFHTLLENAISHNAYTQGRVVFHLRQETSATTTRFTFTAPLGGEGSSPTASGLGTGLRYVRDRLREAFDDRWRLETSEVDGSWRTCLEIDR